MTGLAPAARLSRIAPSAIGAALRLGERGDAISLAGGLPADEGFPLDEVRAALDKVLAQGAGALQYADTDGLPELREWIAAELSPASVAVDRVLVTHGAQQGLDLVAKALLDPGDVVVVDRPSYLGAVQVFRLFEAEVRSVPIAADPELAELTAALADGLRPRLLYLVPNFANPTGSTLTARQRELLAALADRHDFVIVEDDPYRDLWLGVEPPRLRPLAALSERVVYLGSFSKTLFPGCRVGHLIAPAALMPTLRVVRQAGDLGNSELLQRLTLALLERDAELRERLDRVRALYRERRDALAAGLRARLGDRVSFTPPEGGFFLWAAFSGVDSARLLTQAVRHGVSFVPGAPFHVPESVSDTARLAFSRLPADRADEAAARLARACDEVTA
jgi:2-aminoadipate transaminase